MTTEFAWSAVVGRSAADLAAARVRLMSWAVHRDAGVAVLDAPPDVVAGARARLRVGILGGVRVDGPVEVIDVVDEPERAGFTYRALPGHPEHGVEEFLLKLLDDGDVRFTVRGESAPALWWSRLGAPIARATQRAIIRRYLASAPPAGTSARENR